MCKNNLLEKAALFANKEHYWLCEGFSCIGYIWFLATWSLALSYPTVFHYGCMQWITFWINMLLHNTSHKQKNEAFLWTFFLKIQHTNLIY